MDSTRIAIGGILALLVIVSLGLGYRFLVDHWEDIKTLAIIAIVFGGTVSVAIGGLKLRSGR